MKTVYLDGIFDLFHRGHLESIKKAKYIEPDTHLIVGIISDEDAINYKRKPIFSSNDRYEIIKSLRYVDKVILNAPLIITNEFLSENNIDLVVHGFSDKEDEEKQEEFYSSLKEVNKFKKIDYYQGISTTKIINKVKNL